MKLKTPKNNLKESSSGPFIDWETNKKARKEVLDWWADVEEWNAANDYPYNIENDTDDVSGMFTAIFDMARDLKKDAPELYKRGKAINNRYGYSQIKESVLKEDKTYNVGTIPYMGREFIQAVISTSNDSGVVRRGKRLLSNLEDDFYYKTYMNSEDKHQNVGTLDNQIANFVAEVLDDIQDRQLKKQGERIIDLYNKGSLTEDTVKQNKKWVNKGKEGTHGKFRTKKAADAQRKAMFANGYKEGLEEGTNKFYNPFFIESAYSDYLADKYDDSYYAVYDEDADIIEVYHNDDKINELSVKNAENICIKYGNLKVYKEGLKESAGEVTQQDIAQAVKFAELNKGRTHPLIDLENRIIKIPFGSNATESDLMSEGMLGKWFEDHGFNVSFEKGDYEYTTKGEWINRRAWTRKSPKKSYLRNRLIMTIKWNDVTNESLTEDNDESGKQISYAEVKGKTKEGLDDLSYIVRKADGTYSLKHHYEYKNPHNGKIKDDTETIRADIESGEEALGLLKKFAGNDVRIKYFDESLKEATTKSLTPQDKADIKNKLNTTNDSELITAYVASKGNKKKDTNQTSVTESADGKANDATDIVKLIDKEFPEIEFVDERDLDNNQVGLIFNGASNVDLVDLGTYLDGLYVWYKIKGDTLLIKADEDANYLEEDNNSFYDPYVTIDAEYEEEDF